jgi:hypothetical protein
MNLNKMKKYISFLIAIVLFVSAKGQGQIQPIYSKTRIPQLYVQAKDTSAALPSDSLSILYQAWDSTFYYKAHSYWKALGSGGSMVYPGAGIPLSTGSGWGTSITNN